jgi:hypothetical protein
MHHFDSFVQKLYVHLGPMAGAHALTTATGGGQTEAPRVHRKVTSWSACT